MGFAFPIPPGYEDVPVWTGNGFRIGSETISVLKYSACYKGWTSDLTEFHETEANHGNHYIDRASRQHAHGELKKNLKDGDVILEIGSSSGFLIQDIKKSFPSTCIIGSDCIPEPLEKIVKLNPDVPLIQFDLVSCPLPDNCIDIVLALNVLEHIEDDNRALAQIYRILKPGGCAIIEVPANPSLYDFYDKQLRHFRRYSPNELSIKSKSAGFTSGSVSHLGFFMYPSFRFIKHRNQQKKGQSTEQQQRLIKNQIQLGGPILDSVMGFVMALELIMGKFLRYPRGIRCLVTLKKEKDRGLE